MNLKFKWILVVFLSVTYFNLSAQDYFGYSNFEGISSALSNPANIAASRCKFNLNLVSTNFNIGTNMYELNNEKLFSFNFNGLKEGVDFRKMDDGNAKHFVANVDFMGPSLLFSINKKISIGLTTRLRTMMNFDNLSNNTFSVLTNTNTNLYDHDYTENNVSYNVHSFIDYGLVYAQQVMKNSKHDLKIGITLKTVKGVGGASVYINSLDAINLKNSDTISKVHGDVDVNYSTNSQELVTGDMGAGFTQIGNSSDAGSCLATDIGVVYEYKNNKKYPYQWRIGLSITDLALSSLTYKNGSQGGSYEINQNQTPNILTSSVSQSPADSYEQYIHSLTSSSNKFLTVNGKGSAKDFTMSLPTALHLNADFHLVKSLYVNTYFLFNLVGSSQKTGTYYTSTYIVSHRFEKKWFCILTPLSINRYSEFNWGLGLKLGPLFLGSGSLISNLMKSNVHNTDLKLALNIPFYRSYKSTQK